jgi:hypothetical protein
MCLRVTDLIEKQLILYMMKEEGEGLMFCVMRALVIRKNVTFFFF